MPGNGHDPFVGLSGGPLQKEMGKLKRSQSALAKRVNIQLAAYQEQITNLDLRVKNLEGAPANIDALAKLVGAVTEIQLETMRYMAHFDIVYLADNFVHWLGHAAVGQIGSMTFQPQVIERAREYALLAAAEARTAVATSMAPLPIAVSFRRQLQEYCNRRRLTYFREEAPD